MSQIKQYIELNNKTYYKKSQIYKDQIFFKVILFKFCFVGFEKNKHIGVEYKIGYIKNTHPGKENMNFNNMGFPMVKYINKLICLHFQSFSKADDEEPTLSKKRYIKTHILLMNI